MIVCYEIKKKKAAPGNKHKRKIPPKAEGHVMQLSRDQSVCAGCGTCELMCALVHEGDSGPRHQRIWVDRNEFEGFPEVQPCHQCDAPECYFACPTGALKIDRRTHARYIDEKQCKGCLACRDACAYDPPRINYDYNPDDDKYKSLKCDLCKDRTQGPACVEFCPQQALIFNIKEESDEC